MYLVTRIYSTAFAGSCCAAEKATGGAYDTYLVKDMDGSEMYGYIKGNLLFTAYDEEGETLGLTDEQILGIGDVLQSMPVVGMMENGEFYPTFLKQ